MIAEQCTVDHTIALLSLLVSTICLAFVMFITWLARRKDRIIDVQDRLIMALQKQKDEA